MTHRIGDPDHVAPDGSQSDVRIFVRGAPYAIIGGDLVRKFSVNTHATGTTVVELSVAAPADAGLARIFPAKSDNADFEIEVWAAKAGQPKVRLGGAVLDYYEARVESGNVVVDMQGRGALRTLIDTPVHLAHLGTVEQLLRAISGNGILLVASDLPPGPVSAWVNAPSAYGAIRLVCSSLDLVAHEKESQLLVTSRAASREALRRAQPSTIRDEHILNSHMTKGTPIRRRE